MCVVGIVARQRDSSISTFAQRCTNTTAACSAVRSRAQVETFVTCCLSISCSCASSLCGTTACGERDNRSAGTETGSAQKGGTNTGQRAESDQAKHEARSAQAEERSHGPTVEKPGRKQARSTASKQARRADSQATHSISMSALRGRPATAAIAKQRKSMSTQREGAKLAKAAGSSAAHEIRATIQRKHGERHRNERERIARPQESVCSRQSTQAETQYRRLHARVRRRGRISSRSR